MLRHSIAELSTRQAMMASPQSVEEKEVENGEVEHVDDDADAAFGGYAERKKLERKLLWKLDCRLSILMVIYILNYVRCALS